MRPFHIFLNINAFFRFALILTCLVGAGRDSLGQDDTETDIQELGGDGYREGQYPGLGRAASGIFYAESRVTFSGYAELANVFNGGEPRDVSSGDLELYFSQLYRIAPFVGIRLSDRLFWTTEFGIEYLEGNGEHEFHFFPESYLDIIVRSEISFRLGIQPLNIGYINNNEEPVLFLSVNRPETERLILPSEWIETGITAYGTFSDKLNYSISFTNGILGKNFQEPTWIRGGADGQLESFNKLAINAQLNYLPAPNVTLSLSNYYNQTGRDESAIVDGVNQQVKAPIHVISGYGRWDKGGFGLIAMGIYGKLNDTYELFQLTGASQSEPQVIGEEAYGFYIEPNFDVMRLFKEPSSTKSSGEIFTMDDPSLPVFIRYERLDTHSAIDPRFSNRQVQRNNLNIWMVGLNFKPNHYFAAKFNVRFRDNLNPVDDAPEKETLYELGIGIEF